MYSIICLDNVHTSVVSGQNNTPTLHKSHHIEIPCSVCIYYVTVTFRKVYVSLSLFLSD